MFLDEGGFSLLPLVRRTWAPRGETPILRRVGRHRDKVSSISAISLSPSRRRVGLYYRFFPKRSVKAPDVVAFLRLLLRHLPRGFVVLWDRGQQHRARETSEFLRRHRRVTVEYLPAYAPELNPDEHFWALLKNHRMANHGYPDLPTLHKRVAYHAARVRKRPELLWGCIQASELSL